MMMMYSMDFGGNDKIYGEYGNDVLTGEVSAK